MLTAIGKFKSNDGTIKKVFRNENNEIIEISLLMNKKYDVIVVPTHHYCSLGCKMCHLTNENHKKKMTKVTEEELLEAIYNTLVEDNKKVTNKEGLLISFMGVGEPLLNTELITNLYKDESAIKKLGYKDINYALATMMPNDVLNSFMNVINENNIPLKIHYSMHSPCDDIRKNLIPSTNVTNEQAMTLLSEYRSLIFKNKNIMESYNKFHRSSEPFEIHYTLIDGVNDSNYELAMLTYFVDKYMSTIKFLRFNPKDELKTSDKQDIWVNFIKDNLPQARVKTYCPPGKDIGSSCGEFTKHFYLEEIETKEEKEEYDKWYKEHVVSKKLILN